MIKSDYIVVVCMIFAISLAQNTLNIRYTDKIIDGQSQIMATIKDSGCNVNKRRGDK